MSGNVLTPLQLIAGFGLLQNQGILVSPELTDSINTYLATPLLTAYTDALNAGAPIYNLSANTVPAFTNSVPTAYSSLLQIVTATYTSDTGTTLIVNSTTGIVANMFISGIGFTSGQTVVSVDNSTTLTISAIPDTTPSGTLTFTSGTMTSIILAQATADFGSGDIGKFIQALNLVQAYGQNTNLFVNSAVNSQTYLGNTFTSTNNMITGDVTTINLATTAFGQDLARLGALIDLNNLGDLGSPLALIQRIVQLTGNIPVLGLLLLAEGVSEDIVLNLTNPTLSVADSIQRLMYQAMTRVTGDALSQILKVLKITTQGIETMADLLNPVRLFPNSYQSLTVVTANGPRAVYVNASGSVNTNLEQELPPYVINTLS
jgi:hypothetical protein